MLAAGVMSDDAISEECRAVSASNQAMSMLQRGACEYKGQSQNGGQRKLKMTKQKMLGLKLTIA